MGKGADHYSSFRTSPAKAWRFPEVEYGNAGSSIAALVLDCDKPARLRRGLPDLPPPNWTVWRRGNHHAHVCWTLDTPVHRYPAARVEPLRYLADIADYYSHAVGADPGYAGVGRNCDLFEAGMRWAGRRANAHQDVLPALMVVNQEFDHPLPFSEVQATARSIEKYRRRWAARGWHCPRWLSRQAARGRKGGRPRQYEPGREPWTLAGMSRATWYRRRERETKANTDKRGAWGPPLPLPVRETT